MFHPSPQTMMMGPLNNGNRVYLNVTKMFNSVVYAFHTLPKGIIFMGRVNDMPKGNIGYFTATLEPGNYALISEVPNASSKNLLKTFVVHD